MGHLHGQSFRVSPTVPCVSVCFQCVFSVFSVCFQCLSFLSADRLVFGLTAGSARAQLAEIAHTPPRFADMTAHNSTHLTMRIFENLPESELNANGLPRGREEDTGTVVTQFTVVRNFPRA